MAEVRERERESLLELLRDAKAELKLVERERDEARKEIENIKKLLLDPNAVHINMLHGQIAKLDWEKLEHIHGNHPAREQLAAERALADRLKDELRELCNTLMTDKPRDITNLLNKAERAIADWAIVFVQRDRDQYGGQLIDSECDCTDCEYLEPIDEALTAWKEARND